MRIEHQTGSRPKESKNRFSSNERFLFNFKKKPSVSSRHPQEIDTIPLLESYVSTYIISFFNYFSR